METVIWIAQGFLAFAFLGAGGLKLARSRDEVREQMPFVEDVSEQQFKAIGAVEVLGALGVVLPAALGILEILTPIAAAGLAITMVVAIAVHVRRDEISRLGPPVVLLALSVFVAIERFGPHSLS